MGENTTIYRALARAQANYKTAAKTGYNPHFKSSFVTFEELVEASREALVKEELSVSQYLDYDLEKEVTLLVTRLQHASGSYIESKARVYLKDPTNIQSLGSAMTYLKRYNYASICGIAASEEDDDGNTLSSPEIASEKQIGFIKTLLKNNPERTTKICNHYGIESLDSLTRNNASEVIKTLQAKPKE